MRLNRLPCLFTVLLLVTACNSPRYSDDVVSETYVHRYGVPLETVEEWSDRGQHGQIISTRKDGVVVARSFDSGVLHGETNYTFPHREAIQKRESYDQGVLTQETWNYSNGVPQRQIDYPSPTNPTTLIWYESGVPQCKESYVNDQLMQAEYYTPSHQLESSVADGHGIRTRRDGYGQLLSVDDIKQGQMRERTTYHANGSPESITPYVNGMSNGQRLTFLPGGEPSAIEEWNHGVQHGNTVIFQNGEKFADVTYQDGKRHGIERRYRHGEVLAEEVSWVQGQQHGPCYSYVGDSTKTTWYVQDKEVNKATYDAFQRQ